MTDPKEMRLLRQQMNEEMRNRISMALKDPALQQGFEIICKENAELKAEIENDRDLPTVAYMQGAENQKKKDEKQLAKAKEIIKDLIDLGKIWLSEEDDDYSFIEQAEQFLKETKEND